MTRAGSRHDAPGALPGQTAAPARGGPAAFPPDARLQAYVRAFPGCGADVASFHWRADAGSWFRVKLEADAAGRVRFAAEPVALPHRLTARELDVLTLLAIGLSNTDIGTVLFASPRTVSTHVEHILAKLGQASRTAAAAMAVERGYLRLPLPGRGPVLGSLTICQLETLARGGQDGEVEPDLETGQQPGAGTAWRPRAAGAPRMAGVPRMAGAPRMAEPPRTSERPRAAERRRTAERPLRIGSALPLSGPAGGDGQQMVKGSALAIAEINARGGIGGRLIEQVVVDADIFSPDGVERAFRRLFDSDVDALTSGYVFPENVAARLAAEYGAPYVHAMTSQSQAEIVRDNGAVFRNVFQVCPTEVNYGPGFIRFLDHECARGWQPPSRRIAFVDTDLPSGQMVNARTISAAEQSGWEISSARTVSAIGADWSALIAELERLEPAAVMIAQFLAGELAAFQGIAAARLPGTVIYAIYAPSVPEFLEAAGQHAEGIVWATLTGTYSDSIGRRFRADYSEAYGEPPGWSHAGIAFDEIHLLARALMAVQHPRDFAAVSRELRRLRYRGVNGSYFLDNAEQSGLGFPDTTPDPSLGLAHLVLQVQNGSHRIISPAPYAESSFRRPAYRPAWPRALSQ
ncbi:MAG TPA: ABC transporter substrate-binding protein [Streptosporangiaceae bacterium]